MLLVEVRGDFSVPSGPPSTGTAEFYPRVSSIQSSTEIIAAGITIAELDESGMFSVFLQATDAPGFLPTGWSYRVIEKIDGRLWRVYDIFVPSASQGSGIDLVTVAKVEPASGDVTTFVSQAQLAAETTARTNADLVEAAARATALDTALHASTVAVVDNGDGTVSFYTAAPPRALVVDVGDGTLMILTTDYSVIPAIDNENGTITFPATVPSLLLVTDNGDGTLSLAA